MTRDDPELGPVKRCRRCQEWWPTDAQFFKPRARTCNACRADLRNQRPFPLRAITHGSEANIENKRAKDRVRKKALRLDPVLGQKLRARQRVTQRRYYYRHHGVCLVRRRAEYAAALDRPIRQGFGRPRIVV